VLRLGVFSWSVGWSDNGLDDAPLGAGDLNYFLGDISDG
jgi:hypothetical protein